MPRKAELQAEEAAVSSPLRRSSRISLTSSVAGTPTRGNSQSQAEVPEAKATRTRRGSLSQENVEKDEKAENKPAVRTRRGSVPREVTEAKPEPTRTRGHRSSATPEPQTKSESKPENKPTTRSRRSSVTEETPEPETSRSLRTRRNSATDKPEDDTEKQNARGRRSMSREKTLKEDTVKKPSRSRRNSVDRTEETVEEEKDKKKPTRTRRTSTDKLDDEPEIKTTRLTPSKSRRRLSVSENTITLEPIKEQDSENKGRKSNSPKTELKVVLSSPPKDEENKERVTETTRSTPARSTRRPASRSPDNKETLSQNTENENRKSGTPTKGGLDVNQSPEQNKTPKGNEAPIPTPIKASNGLQIPSSETDSASGLSLTPVKKSRIAEARINLELSIIEESSFFEEPSEEGKSEHKTTPRHSPRLQKKRDSPSNQALTPRKSPRIEKMKVDVQKEDAEEEESVETKTVEVEEKEENIEDASADRNSDDKVLDTSMEKDVKVTAATSAGMNKVESVKEEEQDNNSKKSLITEEENKNVETTGAPEETASGTKTVVSEISTIEDEAGTSTPDNPNISMGSDGSFRFHLDVSLGTTCQNLSQKDVEDREDLNSSTISASSDKENIETDISGNQSVTEHNKENLMESLIGAKAGDKESTSQEVIVSRVSNVFRPKMKENSFLEPMEVDEYPSMLDTTHNKVLLELDESNVLPSISTPVANKNVKKTENVENVEESKAQGDVITIDTTEIKVQDDLEDESFSLSLSVTHIEESASKMEETASKIEGDILDKSLLEMNKASENSVSKKISTADTAENSAQYDHFVTKTDTADLEDPEEKLSVKNEGEELTELNNSSDKIQAEEVESLEDQCIQVKAETEKQTSDKGDSEGVSQISTVEKDESKSVDIISSRVPEFSPNLTSSGSKLSPRPPQTDQKLELDDDISIKPKSPLLETSQVMETTISENPQSKSDEDPELLTEKKMNQESESCLTSQVPVHECFVSVERIDTNSPEDDVKSTETPTIQVGSDSPGLNKPDKDLLTAKEPLTESEGSDQKDIDPKKSPQLKTSLPQQSTENEIDEVASGKVNEETQAQIAESEESQMDLQDKETTVSPESPRLMKADMSDEYEFDVPSDEEEADKTEVVTTKSDLKENDTLSPKRKSITLDDESTEANGSCKKIKISEDETETTCSEKQLNETGDKIAISSKNDLEEPTIDEDNKLKGQVTEELPVQEITEDVDMHDHGHDIKDTCKVHVDEGHVTRGDSKKQSMETDQVIDASGHSSTEPISENAKADNHVESMTTEAQSGHVPSLGSPENDAREEIREVDIQNNQDKGSISSEVHTSDKNDLMTKSYDEMEGEFKDIIQDQNDAEENFEEPANDTAQASNSEENRPSDHMIIENDDVVESVDGKLVTKNRTEGGNEMKSTEEKLGGIESKVEDVKDISTEVFTNEEEITNELESKSSLTKPSKRKSKKPKKRTQIQYENKGEASKKDTKPAESSISESYECADHLDENKDVMEEDISSKKSEYERNLTKIRKKKSKKRKRKTQISDENEDEPLENEETQAREPPTSESNVYENHSDEDQDNVIEIPTSRSESEGGVAKSPKKKSRKSSKKKKQPVESLVTESYTCESRSDEDKDGTNVGHKKSKKLKKKSKKHIDYSGLEKFANAKLDEYLSKKISEMESETDEVLESDEEKNEFICTMAEEGEEDTPSEGSNDIVDEGESIHSTDTEVDFEEDNYDEDDSFICDEDVEELLSGDEFDLGDEKVQKKERKSRIIQLDNSDDDIIKVHIKEKPPAKKKKSRIIPISDSSESEGEQVAEGIQEDKEQLEAENVQPEQDSSKQPNTNREDFNEQQNPDENESPRQPKIPSDLMDEEEPDEEDDVIFLGETPSPIIPSTGQNEEDANSSVLTTSAAECEDQASSKKRKSSITIHENISVSDIKDAALSERISNLVDTFCMSIRKGEISMNLSLEYPTKENSEGSLAAEEVQSPEPKKLKKSKKSKKKLSSLSDDAQKSQEVGKLRKKLKKKPIQKKLEDASISESSEEDSYPKRKERLSVTLDDIGDDSDDSVNKRPMKRRLSRSVETLSEGPSKAKKKKPNKGWKKEKKDLLMKKTIGRWKPNRRSRSYSSDEDLQTQTFSIMNRLITDVKNRPPRKIAPSRAATDMNNSWITEIADVRPSTTIVSRRERTEYKSGKIHPKDFRSQMLYDSSRIKRVDTKTLLKKRGAYF